MKKRILVVARMSPRVNGRTRYLIEALQPHYDIDVLCEAAPGGIVQSGFPDSVRLMEKPLFLPGRRVGLLTGAVRVAQLNLLTLSAALRGDYCAVVANDAPYAIGAVLARRLFGVPMVFNAHEIAWALGSGPALDSLMRALERQALVAADVVMAPSQTRARLALEAQRLERNVVVYENFPVLSETPARDSECREQLHGLGVPRGVPVVLFQGTFVPRRGLESLVAAAATGAFHLVLQGFGPLRSMLVEQKHAGMTILDPCLAEETVPWTAAADLAFVYYENDCLNSAWACSSKFYSAVFAETPVLCNRLPAFEEFAREYGGVHFFDRLDAGHLAERIHGLFADPAGYRRLRAEMAEAHRQMLALERQSSIQHAFADLVESCA